jgi:hypothetical protein
MLILDAALIAFLATRGAAVKPPSPTVPAVIATLSGPELARAIKTDLETIAGAGTVNVSVDRESSISARIAIRGFSSNVCTQIYNREMELHQLFPELNFDFYFGGPELARAIKADLESISGRGTVDVSIDSKTLFNVKIAIPDFSSPVYNQIFDRELEFYRACPDLNFDFYLRRKPVEPAPAR